MRARRNELIVINAHVCARAQNIIDTIKNDATAIIYAAAFFFFFRLLRLLFFERDDAIIFAAATAYTTQAHTMSSTMNGHHTYGW